MAVVVVLVALGHTLHVHDTRAVGRKSGLVLAHVGGFWTAGLQLESGGAEAVVLRYPWLLIRAKFHALSFTLHRLSFILIGSWGNDVNFCCILGVAALMEFTRLHGTSCFCYRIGNFCSCFGSPEKCKWISL